MTLNLHVVTLAETWLISELDDEMLKINGFNIFRQDRVLNIINHACPTKTVKMTNEDPPYVTPLIKILLKKKYRLNKLGKTTEVTKITSEIGNLMKTAAASKRGGRGTAAWWQYIKNHAGSKSILKSNYNADES